jgi:putative nucleotidyltransferase with HDIG domain
VKILIVDDKEDARYLLQSLLTGHGHDVVLAINGEEALKTARKDNPDLIISDILMPVMDGFRLCQEIRKDKALHDKLFVFYTATYTQESDADFALKIGADDFIRKPTEPGAFLARIEAVVEKASRAEKGRRPQITEEAEVLRLYSERLVAKLEKRSQDLQEELARRQKAEESLRRHARRLETLREIDIAILEARSPESVAQIALGALRSILFSACANVTVFDEARGEAKVLAVQNGTVQVMRPGDVFPVAAYGSLDELAEGKPKGIRDLKALAHRTAEQDRLLEAGIRSYIVVPLWARGELTGSLNVGFSGPGEATEDVVQAASEMANQLAIALRQTQLRLDVERHAAALEKNVEDLREAKAELERSYLSLSRALSQTVEALATAAEVRDPYTAGHQRRVTRLAVAIASALGLDDARVEGLRVAGLMHDIGKMAIPAELLSKPSRLSPVEYELIRSHPKTACDILKTVEFPWPICDIVLQHHERIDGSGYPNGLKGGDILLEARILAVADVVEAMSSHRPYRPALGLEAAMTEIRDGAGTRYDAQVVATCTDLIERGEFELSEPE